MRKWKHLRGHTLQIIIIHLLCKNCCNAFWWWQIQLQIKWLALSCICPNNLECSLKVTMAAVYLLVKISVSLSHEWKIRKFGAWKYSHIFEELERWSRPPIAQLFVATFYLSDFTSLLLVDRHGIDCKMLKIKHSQLAENPVKDRRGIFALIKIFCNKAHFLQNCRNFVKLNQNNRFCNTRLLQKRIKHFICLGPTICRLIN